ncbi:hypothetical protein ACFLQP_01935 [Acidobacteriota bacterium]
MVKKRFVFVLKVCLIAFCAIRGYADFSVESNRIVFKNNQEVTKIVKLAPQTPDGKQGYFVDKVYHNYNYVLIYRNYHWLGDFDHTPGLEKIEVYDRYGEMRFTITDNTRQYIGEHHFSEHWLVVVKHSEGEFMGYSFIHMQKQQYGHHTIKGYPHFIHAFLYHTGFGSDKDTVWIICGTDFKEYGICIEWLIMEVDEQGKCRKCKVKFNPDEKNEEGKESKVSKVDRQKFGLEHR